MKPIAIVYSSNTGFTERYAKLLGKKTGLSVYRLGDPAAKKGTTVIYLGWLMAGHVKDYRRAAKRYTVKAVCAVGLCGTGMLQEQTRKATGVPASVPLFTLQGGMDHGKLQGLYKSMIQTLIKVLAAKKKPTEEERAMLELIQRGGDFVQEDNLKAVLNWYRGKETIC